jgi:hypothetical protein
MTDDFRVDATVCQCSTNLRSVMIGCNGSSFNRYIRRPSDSLPALDSDGRESISVTFFDVHSASAWSRGKFSDVPHVSFDGAPSLSTPAVRTNLIVNDSLRGYLVRDGQILPVNMSVTGRPTVPAETQLTRWYVENVGIVYEVIDQRIYSDSVPTKFKRSYYERRLLRYTP